MFRKLSFLAYKITPIYRLKAELDDLPRISVRNNIKIPGGKRPDTGAVQQLKAGMFPEV
jgi:hypothetical protein